DYTDVASSRAWRLNFVQPASTFPVLIGKVFTPISQIRMKVTGKRQNGNIIYLWKWWKNYNNTDFLFPFNMLVDQRLQSKDPICILIWSGRELLYSAIH